MNRETEVPETDESDASVQIEIEHIPSIRALYRVRLRPVEFARLVGVSKATVSSWTTRGLIPLGVDGRVDPAAAVKALLSRPDAARLRSRFLAGAFDELEQVRRVAEEARAEAARLRGEISTLRSERDALAAHLADAEASADVMASRLFVFDEAVRAALPMLADQPAAAEILCAALASEGDRE